MDDGVRVLARVDIDTGKGIIRGSSGRILYGGSGQELTVKWYNGAVIGFDKYTYLHYLIVDEDNWDYDVWANSVWHQEVEQ